ncbi:hypothetical protein [Enterococcus italicus]|uniref:hypothetical protein n=1 Tax=Enterococcus italicus TaxID=246144 RepID=UPI00207471AA|nr:hypothetical protein [Enterococcus italicus]
MSETVKRITELRLCGSDSRAQSYNEGLKAAIHILESCEQPQLNENQKIVLEYFKKMNPPKLGVSAMVAAFRLVDDNINDNWQEYYEEIPPHIEALRKLSVKEENQVLQTFVQWLLEQEEE